MTNEPARLKVFYDGACPLCRREIGFYMRQTGAERIAWIDISGHEDGGEVVPGLSAERAKARFHVLTEDGTLLAGAAAFAAIWRRLKWFWLPGVITGLPGIVWIADRVYDVFLIFRPSIQRFFIRKDEREGR